MAVRVEYRERRGGADAVMLDRLIVGIFLTIASLTTAGATIAKAMLDLGIDGVLIGLSVMLAFVGGMNIGRWREYRRRHNDSN